MFESSDKYLYTQRRDSKEEYLNNQKEISGDYINIGLIKEHIIDDHDSSGTIDNGAFQDQMLNLSRDLNIASETEADGNNSIITGEKMLSSSNMFPVKQIHDNRFNKFARYGIIDPAHAYSGGREYLFFSKPDLHIFDPDQHRLNPELSNCAFFQNAFNQYPESLYSLQQTYNYLSSNNISIPNKEILKNKFIPLLSNQVSSSLDLPGISSTDTQNNANLYQINTSYRDGSEISDCSFDFTLEFRDTKYLDVYMFFKAYDEYFRQKYLKMITPVNLDYITSKVDDSSFSIWKIIVDDTNTITFWAKAIAVTPMSVARDAMSGFEEPIKQTINFKGQFVRDMNPIQLMELNHLSALTLGIKESAINSYISKTNNNLPPKFGVLPLYNKAGSMANTEWGSVPYIIKKGGRTHASSAEKELYRLIWLKNY